MKTRFVFILILPFILFLIIAFVMPLLLGVRIAFFPGETFSLDKLFVIHSFSLSNFREAFSTILDSGLLDAFRNTVVYTLCVTLGSIVLGLFGAMIVMQKFRSVGVVRVLLLLSWVVPTYIVGLLWSFMWQQDEGVINTVLFDYLHWDKISGAFGAVWEYSKNGSLIKPNWLTGPNTIWAIIIPTIWRNWPFCMMMFLSGLSAIPHDIYEVAEIDGVTARERFFHITLPILRPIFALILLESLVVNVYSFNLVAMMFGNAAGFPGKYGDLLMTYIYRTSFQTWNFGVGAALGTLLMMMMLASVSVWYHSFAKDLKNG